MPEINFKSLQNMHESLLQKQSRLSEENKEDFAKEVKEYIEQAKRGGSYISSGRERDQLRANLRYWANYLYSIDGTFPDTELAPPNVKVIPFFATTFGILIIIVLMIAAISFLGRDVLQRLFSPPPVLIPTITQTSTTLPTDSPIVIPTNITSTESPTPEPSGLNVIMSSPANGDHVTPNIVFEGTYYNLKPGWTIHVLLIRDDKYFPVKDPYTVTDQTTGDWIIRTRLAEKPEDISKVQSYVVVLAICTDPPSENSTRELLSNASETGINLGSLPGSVITFDKASSFILRDAYTAVQETRLVYSFYNGISYDIYTSKPDGSDIRQITFSKDVDELSPQLSPDGTKIVYRNHSASSYTISIMDSNGKNDYEIVRDDKNILESPQWSPDSSYISYAMGDTSSNPPRWSIHAYTPLTEEDQIVSGAPEALANRYFSWIPNKNIVVFNARIRNTSRFIQVPIDSLETFSVFFDPSPEQEVIQPNIEIFRNGYLLTYTVVKPDFIHEIYAVIDSDGQVPFDGSPVKLTKENNGADLPIFEPPNSIYYIGIANNIYEVKFAVEGNKIILVRGANTDDGEYYGDLVIKTGQGQKLSSFDIGYMDAFFPIR